jgi:nickel-dependent lactate racemase
MGRAVPLSCPEEKIRYALENPTGTLPLKKLIKGKLQANPHARAAVVISDSTRPIPYKGKSGILLPLIKTMVEAGLRPSKILLLVATGIHRPMKRSELEEMLDPRIFSLGLKTINHDARNMHNLALVGRTEIGSKILINRTYVESDIKILTGLVESHFMAGVSGGRKSICPGLLAEASTHVLHGGPILDSPASRDLILKGNPVHEEAVRVGRMAGCDMILNVTLDANFKLTGVFAGEMVKAHAEAYRTLRSYAGIPVSQKYDLVLTHAGFVGVNHYQAAKGALVCELVIKKNGTCILAAMHTDKNPLGSSNYRRMMHLLGEIGANRFIQMIQGSSWKFVPEQWEAQMWTRLFKKIPPENLIYCSHEIPRKCFSWLPGTDARSLVPEAKDLRELVERALHQSSASLKERLGREPSIAVLPDGPYGIPMQRKE